LVPTDKRFLGARPNAIIVTSYVLAKVSSGVNRQIFMYLLIQLIQQASGKILVMFALGGMGIVSKEQDNPPFCRETVPDLP